MIVVGCLIVQTFDVRVCLLRASQKIRSSISYFVGLSLTFPLRNSGKKLWWNLCPLVVPKTSSGICLVFVIFLSIYSS